MATKSLPASVVVAGIPDIPDTPVRGWFKFPNDLAERIFVFGISAFAVYAVLRRFSNEAMLSWPSVPTIARMTGLDQRSVYRALNKLESIKVIRRMPNRGKVTTYRILY